MVKWKHMKKQWWKTLRASPEKNRSFLSLGLRSIVSSNISFFESVFFFIFQALKVTSRNIRTAFFWENIRNLSRFLFLKVYKISSAWRKVQGSISGNIRKDFVWENTQNFFRVDSFRKKYNFFLGKNFETSRVEAE